MAHTPGPWTYNYSGKDASTTGMGCGYGKSQIVDSKGRALAGVAAVPPDDGSPMYEKGGLSQATLDLLVANARLIASAPDLLAALRAVYACFEDGSPPREFTLDAGKLRAAFAQARAAIEKAS